MASAFSHAIASFALGKIYSGNKQPLKFWLLAAFCAVVPDADALGFKFGIGYETFFGHRGFTHSIFFSLLLAFAVVLFFYPAENPGSKKFFTLLFFFFCCTLSHPVLDAMTDGGLGVAFFSPFSNERYFFSFRPIKVSPLSVEQFFGEWGWRVIKSEVVWVWLPSFAIILLAKLFQSFKLWKS